MSQRNSNDRPIKDAVSELLKKYHLDDKMKQVQLIDSWATVMGAAVSHRTSEIKIIDRKLFVSLSSASLRQELFQDREQILQRLNESVGGKVVDEIVFK